MSQIPPPKEQPQICQAGGALRLPPAASASLWPESVIRCPPIYHLCPHERLYTPGSKATLAFLLDMENYTGANWQCLPSLLLNPFLFIRLQVPSHLVCLFRLRFPVPWSMRRVLSVRWWLSCVPIQGLLQGQEVATVMDRQEDSVQMGTLGSRIRTLCHVTLIRHCWALGQGKLRVLAGSLVAMETALSSNLSILLRKVVLHPPGYVFPECLASVGLPSGVSFAVSP